jgi:hypothetical protein
MPIHFEDQDVVSEAAGLRSALIVPCNLCPAVTVAARQNEPFMRFFRSPVKSAPFEEYLKAMQSRLDEKGVQSKVFRSSIYHQWFMCMWTERLGCDSATETVREVVAADVKVIEGMNTTGIMNGRMSFRLPDKLVFDGCKVVPISQQKVA